jgi:hypothetical protein
MSAGAGGRVDVGDATTHLLHRIAGNGPLGLGAPYRHTLQTTYDRPFPPTTTTPRSIRR